MQMHPKILALRRPIAVYKSIYCLSALLFFLELGIQSIYLANSVLFELGMIFADCPIAKCDDGYHCFIIVKKCSETLIDTAIVCHEVKTIMLDYIVLSFPSVYKEHSWILQVITVKMINIILEILLESLI
ncbi:hypothetical protein BCV71DRAFT_270664 [Rhizopus microsporus]|uniref:Uncharacterized protein n=1 Tax=Rhizopus microsporus TaxID=58291 RepID=A0A1X0RY60_RHIZD|nr:hypothetical protein BCV71DRAFT_270664 [Rhizopus microsporus]